jgi:hypothetical protein
MRPISDEHVPPPFALSIASAVRATGNAISRTRLFDLIRTGEVDARKVGRRTVVMAESLRAYVERQPKAAA